ncbi:MAG: hypothetical protein GY918_10005, partial [Gammaproteobacteria bacterium]|nr:hypothetical protein [Gammaproteobacteria bacterium]
MTGFEQNRVREFIEALYQSFHVVLAPLNQHFVDELIADLQATAELRLANGENPQLTDFTSWIINKLRQFASGNANNADGLSRDSQPNQPLTPPRPSGGGSGGGGAPPGPGNQNPPPPLPPGPPAENAQKFAERAQAVAQAAQGLSGADRARAEQQAAELHDMARRSANQAVKEARDAISNHEQARAEADAANKAAVDYAQERKGRDWTEAETKEAGRLNAEAAKKSREAHKAEQEAKKKVEEAEQAVEATNEAGKKVDELINPEEQDEDDKKETETAAQPEVLETSLLPSGPGIEGMTPINPPPWLPVVPQPPSGRGILVGGGQFTPITPGSGSVDDCIKKLKDCAKKLREGLLSGTGTGTTGALPGGGTVTGGATTGGSTTGVTDGSQTGEGKKPCDPCDPNVILAGLLDILVDAAAARLGGNGGGGCGCNKPAAGNGQSPSGPTPAPSPATPPDKPDDGGNPPDQPPDDTGGGQPPPNGSGSGGGQVANPGTPPGPTPNPTPNSGANTNSRPSQRREEDPPRSVEEIESDIKEVEKVLETVSSEIRPRLVHQLNSLYRELLRARGVKGIKEGSETLVPGDEILTDDGNVHPVYRTFQVLIGNRGFAVTKINGKHVVTTARKTVTLDNGRQLTVWDFSKARPLKGKDWEVIELLSITHWSNMAKRMIYSSETVGKDFIDEMLKEAEQQDKTTTTLQADMTGFILLSHFYGGIDFVRPNPGDSYRAGQAEMDKAFDPRLSTGERVVHAFGAFGYAVLTVVEVIPIPGASAADEVVTGIRKAAKKLDDTAEALARKADEATTQAQRKAANEASERLRRQAAEMKRQADELAEAIRQARRASIEAATNVRGCFSPDTAVLMADGAKKPIADVQKGDHILSAKDHGAEVTSNQVEHIWRVPTKATLKLKIEGSDQVLSVTEHHRMATDQGYQAAYS